MGTTPPPLPLHRHSTHRSTCLPLCAPYRLLGTSIVGGYARETPSSLLLLHHKMVTTAPVAEGHSHVSSECVCVCVCAVGGGEGNAH